MFAALPLVLSACDIPSRAERTLIHNDAESFEAVVRAQVEGEPDSARQLRFLRVDSRPVDNASIFPAGTERQGVDLDEVSALQSPGTLARITRQRGEILKRLGVEEGGPFIYPACGGTHVGMPDSDKVVRRGSNCPAVWRRYITIGLPDSGIARFVGKVRRPELETISDSSEVWTVLVTESSIGPGGQDWRQYAWVLRRDPATRGLAEAERFLLSWAE